MAVVRVTIIVIYESCHDISKTIKKNYYFYEVDICKNIDMSIV
jgi:hypothetical protein